MIPDNPNFRDLAQRIESRLRQAEKLHQFGLAMHDVRSDISTWYAGACTESCLEMDADFEAIPETQKEEMHRRLVMAILGLCAIGADPSLRDDLLTHKPPCSDWLHSALQDDEAPEEIQGFYSGLLIGHLIAKKIV